MVRARMTVGPAFVLDGGLVRGVNLARIVATETQAAQRFVGKRLDELQQARIAAEEMLADVRAGFHDELLVFAVDQLAHALDEQAFGVALENGIPLAAPEDLDDVPARAAEGGFELLNDLAVAANGTVEALQVAVDDEDEVVELFAGGEGDGAERFGLVGFAVAEEGPDLGVGGGLEAAIFEIAARSAPDKWPSAGSGPWRRWETPRNRASARDADRTKGRRQASVRGGNFRVFAQRDGLREKRARKCRERRGPGNRWCRLRIARCGRGRNG